MVLLIGFSLAADQLTSEFYDHVNSYREHLGLSYLEDNKKAEKVARSYSSVLAEIGHIDHHALTEVEFYTLCQNYDLTWVTLREILISYDKGLDSFEIFSYFYGSEDHRLAMIDPEGKSIGAGYVTYKGRTYFTAYIVIPKEKTWN